MGKVIFKLIFISLVFLLACNKSVADDMEFTLRQAEMAVAAGDMITASSIAGKIDYGKNLSGLNAEKLARLSLIYMQIADSLEPEDNISKAADLYKKAFELDADSAALFFTNVDAEQVGRTMMLSALVKSLEYPDDSIADFEPDSIGVSDFLVPAD